MVVQSVLQHAFGLAVHDNYIYWTDWVLRAVLRANKYTGGDVFHLRRNLQRQPMGLVIETTEMNTCQYLTFILLIELYSLYAAHVTEKCAVYRELAMFRHKAL